MKLHTVIILLANAYMELTCIDPWMPELKRHWVLRRTVDYRNVCMQ
jgi:hypothetical protein